MRDEDQHFADFVLSSISHDLKKVGEYSGQMLDSFDSQFNQVADQLRDAIQSSSWIPDQVKAQAPPPPPRRAQVGVVPAGYLDQVQTWVNKNRAWAAAIAAFAGTTFFLMWRSRRSYRLKRRARKANTGAKTEVVIVSGSPFSPLTKSLALDLERRGFLVYIPVGSLEEESAVAELRVADISPLNFDITSTDSVSSMLSSFSRFLSRPQRAGTISLHLASLILLPPYPPTYATGPAHLLSTQSWSETLNTHILYPISIANTFLPLLLSQSPPSPGLPAATVLLLSPSTTSSFQPPHHAPESVSTNALESYLSTLRTERPVGISAVHIRLGALDLTPADQVPQSQTGSPNRGRAQITLSAWNPRNTRGKDSRELHNAVFDAVVGRECGTVFVGRGARTYALIGAWAPRGLVGWLVRRKEARNEGVYAQESSQGLGRRVSPGSSFGGSRSGSAASAGGSETSGAAGASQEWERVE